MQGFYFEWIANMSQGSFCYLILIEYLTYNMLYTSPQKAPDASKRADSLQRCKAIEAM